MTASGTSGNYVVHELFLTYEKTWDRCKADDKSDRYCWSELENLRDRFWRKCMNSFNNRPACEEVLLSNMVQGFVPPVATDQEVWEKCRQEHSKKTCTKNLESSHQHYVAFCHKVSYRSTDECNKRLAQLVIREFKPT